MRLSNDCIQAIKITKHLFQCLFLFFVSMYQLTAAENPSINTIDYDKILKKYQEDLRFKQNIGNYPKDYKFALQSSQLNVGFGQERIYSWVYNTDKTKRFSWIQQFIGKNPACEFELKSKDSAQYTYLNRNNSKSQEVGKELWINDLYHGIDLRYYSRGDQLLEYDFLVDPCTDPTTIIYELEGFDQVTLAQNGKLKMISPFGDLYGSKPYAYQMIDGKEVVVDVEYQIVKDQIRFILGNYNEEEYLIIDPIVLEWSTFLEGSFSGEIDELDVNNNGVYVVGGTQSTDFPVTAGVHDVDYSDKIDAFVAKLNFDGELQWATYFGGTSTENNLKIEIVNNSILVAGTTASEDLQTTDGAYQENWNGSSDVFIASFTDSGILNWSSYIGGSDRESNIIIESDGTNVFFAGTTSSNDMDITAGAYQDTYQGNTDNFLGALDFDDGAIHWISYLGGSSFEGSPIDIVVDGSNITLAFASSSSIDLPVLNANQMNNGGSHDGYVAQFGIDGIPVWITYIGGDGFDRISDFDFDGSSFYLGGSSNSTNLATPGAYQETVVGGDCWLASLTNTGSVNWSTYINGNSQVGESGSEQIKNIEVDNGYVYFIADTNVDFPFSPDLLGPITQGQSWYSDIVVGRFTISGQYGWVTYYAGENVDRGVDVEVANGLVYVLAYINSQIFPISEYAVQELPGGGDQVGLGMFKEDSGNLVYSTYFGGSTKGQFPEDLEIFGEDVYFTFNGASQSPVTVDAFQSTTQASRTGLITKFTPIIGLSENMVAPNDQVTCQFGIAEPIVGNQVLATNNLPQINYGTTTVDHPDVEASYQWQQADDPTGPWEDILIGIQQNYLPGVGNITQYYRRLAFFECTSISNISNVVSVTVNEMVALQVDAGPPFYTCPGTPITIGGNPTVTSGVPPYTYDWDMEAFLDDETLPNPTATITETTIFTVVVTDANGCSQIGQTVITPVSADAGMDHTVCLGTAVQIGTAPLPGVTGATYAWTPSIGLNNADIAQPIASPNSNTTYFLSVTLETPTGPCTTMDQVSVNQVPAPALNFAGPDVVSCNVNPANIGTIDEGFTYVWSPSTYLSNNVGATTTVTPFFNDVPSDQPLTYTLQATMGDCVYEDQVDVAFVNANAGIDFCGPRIIGDPPQTDLNPTYMWTNLTPGIGTITPPINTAQIAVSASLGGTATYLLEVTYNGTTCTDEVNVPEGCEGCLIDIAIEPIGCPLLIDGGELTLTGNVNITGYNPNQLQYSWTPTTGLTDPNSLETNVTTMDNIVYTLTVTDLFDNFLCSAMIDVNNPNYSIPIFEAQDHEVCVGVFVNIGQEPVVGYEYQWAGPNEYISMESNPTILAQFDEEYYVTVTETETGCVAIDTAFIDVSDVFADAGEDIEICSGGIVTLGVPDPSNGLWSYSWSPVFSPWQNNTDENSPQPDVLVDTDLEFTVTVTDLAKCFATDVIMIIVNDDIAIENAPDVVYCPGTEPIQIGPEPLNGVEYSWLPANDLSCIDCAQPFASPSSTTIYTVSALFPGCEIEVTDNVIVTVPDYSFNLGGPIDYCPGDGPIAIGDNAPGDAISYQWTPNLNLSCNNCPNPTSSTLVEQNYTLTVFFQDGCSANDDILITPAVLPDAGQDYVICLEESVLIGTPSTADAFLWTPSAGLSCIDCATPVFTPQSTGIFEFNLTETIGGCENTDKVTVTVLGSDVPDLMTSTVCDGGCVLLEAPYFDNHNYIWSPPVSLSDPNSNVTLACPNETTEYTVVIEDQIFGCITSANALVVVSPEEAPILDIIDYEYCIEDAPIILDLQVNPAVGNYSFSWDPQISLSNPFIQNPVATPLSTETYFVTVTDNSNGCASVAQTTVTVVPCFDCDMVLNATGNSPTCEVDEIMLFVNVTSGAAPFFYSWLGPNGYQSTQQNPIIPNANTQMSGVYTVLVTDANGCTETDMVDMQVFEDPTLSIDITECTDGLDNYFILFSSNGTVSSSAGSVDGNQIINIPLGTDVVVTASLNGCFVEIPVMSPDCPCPTIDPPVDPVNAEICEGDSNPVISVSVGSGIVVDWYDEGMGGNLVQANSISYTPTAVLSVGLHTFYAEAIDPFNDCSSTTRTPVTIFVNENPILEVSSNSPVCTSTDIELYATVNGGSGPYIFSWTGPGGFTSMNQNPILTNATINNAGMYSVTVYSGNNCSSTQSINIDLQSLPTLDVTATNCESSNDTYTITFQTNGSVSTSLGNISGNQVFNVPNNQEVTLIAELNGCFRFVLVEAPDCGCTDLIPPTNPINGEICQNEMIPALGVTVSAGQTANWYDSSVGGNLLASNTTSYTPVGPLAPGVYFYYAETWSLMDECPSAERTQVYLIINENPTVQLSTNIICEGGSVVVNTSVLNGTPPFDYFWNGPNGFSSNEEDLTIDNASVNDAGNYMLFVIDAFGCFSEDDIDVVVDPLPTLLITNIECSTDNQSYIIEFVSTGTVSANGGNVVGNQVINIPAGQNVTLTSDLNGCTVIEGVSAPDCSCPMIFPPISPMHGEICDGQLIPTISVSVPTGQFVNWYDAPIGGNSLASNTNTYTPSGPLVPGIYTYYTEAQNEADDCVSGTRTEVYIIINPNPIVTLESMPVCESETLIVSSTVSGGSAPYTFSWDGPNGFTSTSQNPSISNAMATDAGNYSVTVTDNLGCTAINNIDVLVYEAPTLIITNIECTMDLNFYSINFESNGEVTSSAGTISGNQVLNIPSNVNVILTSVLNTCEVILNITTPDCTCPMISAPINPIDASICEGELTPSLMATVPTGFTINWYDSSIGGTLLATGNSYTPTGSFSPGVYTFYVESQSLDNTCTSNTRTPIYLTVFELPMIVVMTSPVCEGEPININTIVTGGSEPYSFNWEGPQGYNSASQSPQVENANSNHAGTYSATVVDGNGCMDETSIEVIVNPSPFIEIEAVLCSNDNNFFSITFSSNGNVNSNLGLVMGNQVVDIPIGMNVILVSTIGNCTISQTINPPMCSCPNVEAPINPIPAEICEGEPNPTICVSVGSNETVFWYDAPFGGNILLESSSCYTPSEMLSPGVYTYYAAAMNVIDDCFSNTRTPVTITVNPNPSISILIPAVCEGETSIFDISITGGQPPYTFNWSGPNGYMFNGQNPMIENVDESADGTYILVVTDVNGCMAVGQADLLVNPLPILEIIDRICNDDHTEYTVDFMSNGTVTSSSGMVVGNQVVEIPTGIDPTITAVLGDCKVEKMISSPNCNCPLVTAPVNPIPANVCFGEVIPSLSVTVNDDQIVNWYDAFIGGNLLASGTTMYTPLGPLDPGVYTFYTEAENAEDGCTSITRTPVVLTVHDLPIIQGEDIEVCEGEDVTFNIDIMTNSSIDNIQWMGPNGFTYNQEDLTLLNSSQMIEGNYTIIVTNTFGCQASLELVLKVNPLPFLGVIDVLCNEDEDGYSVTFSSNGDVISDFGTVVGNTISNIPTNQMVNVTATLDNCLVEKSVDAPDCHCPFISQPINSMHAAICNGDPMPTISVSVLNPYTVNWYDAVFNGNLLLENSLTYTPLDELPVGVHIFYAQTIDLIGGCESSTRTPVVIRISPNPDIQLMTNPICEGGPLDIMSIVTGVAGITDFSWTGPEDFQSNNQNVSISPATTINDGTYVLNVVSDQLCSTMVSIETEVNANPYLTVETVCVGEDEPYTILFDSNGNVSTTFGSIVDQSVVDIPYGQGVVLTAALGDCEEQISVMAPDCSCPIIEAPISPIDIEVCQSSIAQSVSVMVPAGVAVNWYSAAQGGTLLLANSTSYTPVMPNVVGITSYYAEAFIMGTICSSENRTEVLYVVNECPCSITPNIEIECDNNQTSWDISDDFISIQIHPTSEYASGEFQISIDGVVLELAVNENELTTILGNGENDNPSIIPDGISTYTVRILDVNDATCYEEIEIGPFDPCSPDYFDLALNKVNYSENDYRKYGDEVIFEFNVCNQGTMLANDVVVGDYMADGYTFSQTNNPSWVNVNGILQTTISSIGVSDCEKVLLKLHLKPGSAATKSWVNYGEILSARNMNGIDMSSWDIDSNPGSDGVEERNVLPGDMNDNNLLSTDKGGEEDDHDPADSKVLDLALTKKVTGQQFESGDLVNFVIEVFNQGNTTAHNVSITDYLPQGFIFDSTINNDWSLDDNGYVVYVLETPLLAGENKKITLDLYVVIHDHSNIGDWYNEAEINAAYDGYGNLLVDADSDLDNNPDNDNNLIDGPDSDTIFNGDDNDNEINELANDPFDEGDDDEDDNDAVEILVTSQIGDFVWTDLDGDGIQDLDESGIGNVIVHLFDCDGNQLKSDTTDSNGSYLFDLLIPGSYQIQFNYSLLGQGYAFSPQNQGLDQTLDSDVNLQGLTNCIDLGPGEMNHTIDAGLLPLAEIGNYVWHDLNGDGIQNNSEPGLEGVRVELYTANDNLVRIIYTNQAGNYLFSNLYPGEYYIKFYSPEGKEQTFQNQGTTDAFDSDIDGSNGAGTTQTTILSAGESDVTWDAGFYCCIKVGDLVWLDTNLDHVWMPQENGINNVKVEIFRQDENEDFNLWDFTYTSNKPGTPSDDGYWSMCVAPGTYYVKFLVSEYGLVSVDANVGLVEEIDSDVDDNYGIGTTSIFTVSSGDIKSDIGAGYTTMATLGDRVWFDNNGNGMQEPNESGAPNVEIKVFDEFGNFRNQTLTDNEGEYLVEYLKGSKYYLEFIPPVGYSMTQPNIGSELEDSDVDNTFGINTTGLVTTKYGEHTPNIDAGLATSFLPTDYSGFWGENRSGVNFLEWTIMNESNIDYYIVERLLDNENDFMSIGKVATKGNAEFNKYDFIDVNIAKEGIYYYRINKVDLNGVHQHSEIISINVDRFEVGNAFESSIYPNPASEEFTIEIDVGIFIESVEISLRNVAGQMISKDVTLDTNVSPGIYKYIINAKDLAEGIYNVELKMDGHRLIKKLIIVAK